MATSYPFLAPSKQPDCLGSLQQFNVSRIIGEGGMGYVFAAFDSRLRRPVALKVVKPELAANKNGRERFLREARAMASIRHENVVTVYEVGREGRFPFLAMELLEGETLAARLAGGEKITPREAVAIVRQVCRGLRAAHKSNIVHRDIKPSNIWLQTPDDAVRILDFGLARNDESQLTQTGRLLGTPRYVSPEQVRSEPVDGRTDLYSVGVTLYQMLSGQLPHDEATASQQLAAVVAKRPVPIEQLQPDLPPDLARVVRDLLQKKVERRPATASQVIDMLDAIEWGDRPPVAPPTRSILDQPGGRARPTSPFQWLRRLTQPLSWLVAASVLFPALVAYLLGTALFPPSIARPDATTNMVASELEQPLPKIVSTRFEKLPIKCGVRPGSLFGITRRGRRAAGEYVNVAYQPTYVREVVVMTFDLVDLPRNKKCVDAMLSFTLRGGATSNGNRTVRVYAVADKDPRNWRNLKDLEDLIESGDAVDIGQWDFNNAGYRNNGRVDGIRFSSPDLIEFVRSHRDTTIVLCLWRIDQSNGQTHIYSDRAAEQLLPKLWLKFAG